MSGQATKRRGQKGTDCTCLQLRFDTGSQGEGDRVGAAERVRRPVYGVGVEAHQDDPGYRSQEILGSSHGCTAVNVTPVSGGANVLQAPTPGDQ